MVLFELIGLYTDDPRTCPDAKRIKLVTNIAEIRASGKFVYLEQMNLYSEWMIPRSCSIPNR
jgi:uridylate kinase